MLEVLRGGLGLVVHVEQPVRLARIGVGRVFVAPPAGAFSATLQFPKVLLAGLYMSYGDHIVFLLTPRRLGLRGLVREAARQVRDRCAIFRTLISPDFSLPIVVVAVRTRMVCKWMALDSEGATSRVWNPNDLRVFRLEKRGGETNMMYGWG